MPADQTATDRYFLQKALEQASIRKGFTSPNPAVGCVITDSNHAIISTGHHVAAGQAHAEVDALRKVKLPTTPHTLYITLEPCNHHGKTPPCTEAIIQSGCKRVVYGYLDPNPLVAGAGAARLRAAGIQCDFVSLAEINDFYVSYAHWHHTKLPFVTAKIALTLNGKIAATSGEPVKITGDELKLKTYQLRKKSDAILTTVKTILCDDPQLNIRLPNEESIAKPLYVLDRRLQLPLKAKIFKTTTAITLFYSEEASADARLALEKQGVRCIKIPLSIKNQLDWHCIFSTIGADGVYDLWVEAGGGCFSSLVNQKCLQRAYIYIAPLWLDEGQSAWNETIDFTQHTKQIRWYSEGRDVFCDIHW